MDFDVFIMTDQPETCRCCGTRTEFIDIGDSRQLHNCKNCNFTYILEDSTVPCVKCGSIDVFDELINDIPAMRCKKCETLYHRDDKFILEDENSSFSVEGETI